MIKVWCNIQLNINLAYKNRCNEILKTTISYTQNKIRACMAGVAHPTQLHTQMKSTTISTSIFVERKSKHILFFTKKNIFNKNLTKSSNHRRIQSKTHHGKSTNNYQINFDKIFFIQSRNYQIDITLSKIKSREIHKVANEISNNNHVKRWTTSTTISLTKIMGVPSHMWN
jgi:hypothetical protein